MPTVAATEYEILQMALRGYEAELEGIRERIADLQHRMSRHRKPDGGTNSFAPAKKKHRSSPEGRARIAEAQRRRWADAKKKKP
jgi:hypothetical protein